MQNIKNFFGKISPLLSYIGCIFMSLLIMYYLNGTIGIFLTSALISAFILSLSLTLIALKTLNVEISTETTAASKGDTINCAVKLTNSLLLPVPIAEIEAEATPQFDLGDTVIYKGTAAGKVPNTINIPMKAVHSGRATIRIKRVSLSDFLGIFKFNLNIPEEQLGFRVAVYPDIPDTAVQTDFLKTANMAVGNDDEEEESNETSPIPTGMPGYEHREYVPGDPIKKINWKMSSKRGIYMLRLDEQIRGTGQMFFLDSPVMDDDFHTLDVRDNVIEGALAVLSMVIREGRDAYFYFCADGLWISHEIHEQGDIFRLQEMLSDFVPCEVPSPVPDDIINSGKTPICFTTAVKERPDSVHFIASHYPNALIISAADADLMLADERCWTISKEFEITKVL